MTETNEAAGSGRNPEARRIAVRPRLWVPFAALVVTAFLVHGPQALRLGLYWDDAILYLRGYHAAHGNLVRYVLGDAFGSWRDERPLSYFWFGAARLAFAWSLPAMHLLLVSWLAIEAALVGALARRLVDETWFAVAAGLLFLTYPISPLQVVWASAAHYHGALILSLVAMLGAERAVARRAGVSGWLLPGAVYLAALLTHEELLLLPLAWLAGLTLWPPAPKGQGEAVEHGQRRAAAIGFALFGVALLAYLIWRSRILPLYGHELYSTAGILQPEADLDRLARAIAVDLWPWTRLTIPGAGSPLEEGASILAILVALGSALWIYVAARGVRFSGAASAGGRDRRRDAATRAAAISLLLFGAAVTTRALIPSRLVTTLGPWSRLNFVALPAIALLLPALLHQATFAGRRGLGAAWRAALVASSIGAVAWAGASAQLAVKGDLVRDWRRLLGLFAELRHAAPVLADGSFVVIATDWPEEVASHEEMSSLIAALYDNETLMANDVKHLRRSREGIVSLSFGEPAHWFAPGDYEKLAGLPSAPLDAIAPSRLVLFASRGGVGAIVPELRLSASPRRGPPLSNHGERILQRSIVESFAWRHVDVDASAGRRREGVPG